MPISDVLEDIVTTLRSHHELVLEAPPGAGKTTLVPLALLGESWLEGQKIIMLQPRRIAARAAAERMAALLDEKPGARVGYQTRQESRTSTNTKIIVMTEGVLLRKIQSDPSLAEAGLIIFDEFHERSVESDLSLMLSAHSRDIIREVPLKLLIMSATMQGLDIHRYLNNAKQIFCKGRSYPVEIRYIPKANMQTPLLEHAAQVITSRLEKKASDTLIFLPGQAEINRLQSLLTASLSDEFVLLPLHGSLAKAQQAKAIAPLCAADAHKVKIILATDIAETSLTIDGVSLVVDLGLKRSPRYDPNTGMVRLQTHKISKASSIQRAGRAGRLQNGECIRLWPEGEQASMQENYSAQILEADLAPVLLNIYAWGVDDLSNLNWISSPSRGKIDEALSLLTSLHAITKTEGDQYHITKYGRSMAALPTHPRLAYMIIASHAFGLTQFACLAAAILSEREPANTLGSDFSTRIDITLGDRVCPSTHKDWTKRVKQHYERLRRISQAQSPAKGEKAERNDGVMLCLAYPDRVAQRLEGSHRYKLSNGRIALLDSKDALRNETWLVVVEAGSAAGQRYDKIYSAVALNPDAFCNTLKHLTHTREQIYWDLAAARVIGECSTTIGAITLKSAPLKNLDKEQSLNAVLDYLKKEGFDKLNWNEATQQWRARVSLLKRYNSSQDWPDVSTDTLRDTLDVWLAPYLTETYSSHDLANLDLQEILQNLLPWHLREILQTMAPEKIRVPSGSAILVDYGQNPPVLAVKLQEMFGCNETPTILEGKLALTLHLLSPAKRPLQITQDLSSFWQNSYPEIKKEMKGRYPKHPWPDNPYEALPTRFTKKRK